MNIEIQEEISHYYYCVLDVLLEREWKKMCSVAFA